MDLRTRLREDAHASRHRGKVHAQLRGGLAADDRVAYDTSVSFYLMVAGALLVCTLLLAVVLWTVLYLAGVRPTRFWRRVLWAHLGLAVLHLGLTVPLTFGWLGSHMAGTRRDEAGYTGPRADADGSWLVQTRASLAAGDDRGDPLGETVTLTAGDGLSLRAFWVPPTRSPARATVVMVHGLFRGGLELEPVGAMLRELGCAVLLLELRNHGGSGEAVTTFGAGEAQDVIAAADWVRSRPGSADVPFVLFGVSLGTAAIGMALPHLPRVDGVILDAPIDSVLQTADRMFATAPKPGRRGLHLPHPFRWLVLQSLQLWSGVRFADCCPGDGLRQLPPTTPVLLVGGGQDRRVPPTAVHALFDSLPTRAEAKLLWMHPTATHGRVWVTDPAGYADHLRRFLELVEKA